MKEIRTRETVKDIKVFDRAEGAVRRVRSTAIRTKERVEDLTDDGRVTPSEYAEDRLRYAAENTAGRIAPDPAGQVRISRRRGKAVKEAERSVKTVEQTSRAAIKTTKAAAKGTAKTAEASAKAARETAEKARQAAIWVGKAAAAAAKAVAKAAQAIGKALAEGFEALAAAIGPGGAVAVVVVVILGAVALIAGSAGGVFFSGEGEEYGGSMESVVREIQA